MNVKGAFDYVFRTKLAKKMADQGIDYNLIS